MAPPTAQRRYAARGDTKEHSDDRAHGCGKTEIARRLAKLANAPFTKVEATKFTEVGYVGRDVESIIRDLVEVAISSQGEQKARGDSES